MSLLLYPRSRRMSSRSSLERTNSDALRRYRRESLSLAMTPTGSSWTYSHPIPTLGPQDVPGFMSRIRSYSRTITVPNTTLCLGVGTSSSMSISISKPLIPPGRDEDRSSRRSRTEYSRIGRRGAILLLSPSCQEREGPESSFALSGAGVGVGVVRDTADGFDFFLGLWKTVGVVISEKSDAFEYNDSSSSVPSSSRLTIRAASLVSIVDRTCCLCGAIRCWL
mmetsp:Transcript_8499/g.21211  ORF Transcript_8499/g.21211 Transcript_8499/m.21211 type:complete len:223 (+) Transcript_8499:323-991(+)